MIWNSVDSEHWLVVALVFGLAEVVLQLGLLATTPFHPIGDEVEYIERGRSNHSFSPEPFLRVPFLPALAWIGGRTGHPSDFLRLTTIAFSAGAMAATAGTATRLGGGVIATVLCLGLLLMPERIVLGSRIWPDVYLAAMTSGIALTLSLTPSAVGLDRSAALIGVLVALAVLTRLDALILIPSVTAVWMIVSPSVTPAHASWLIGLPLTAFGVWWLVSLVFLKQRWPDTTWKFNLGITVREALVQQESDTITIDDLIELQPAEGKRRHDEDQPNVRQEHPPVPLAGFLRSVVSRLRALLGPDTFVKGKILARVKWGENSVAWLVLTALLRVSAPFLVAVSIGVFVWHPSSAGWVAIPAISLLIPAIVFHARTRYRLPLLYGLVPVIAVGIGHMLAQPQLSFVRSVIPMCVFVVILGLILAREPRRLERP